jgi:hypothetical protein
MQICVVCGWYYQCVHVYYRFVERYRFRKAFGQRKKTGMNLKQLWCEYRSNKDATTCLFIFIEIYIHAFLDLIWIFYFVIIDTSRLALTILPKWSIILSYFCFTKCRLWAKFRCRVQSHEPCEIHSDHLISIPMLLFNDPAAHQVLV